MSQKTSKPRIFLPLIAAAMALGVSACSSWMSHDSADTTPPASASSESSSTSTMSSSPM